MFWIFFGFFWLLGKLVRLIFDLIIDGLRWVYYSWRTTPREIEGFPLEARFGHTHIVGGSGHGKTQAMQTLILKDLWRLAEEGRGSVIVIDSHGDMINNILHLEMMQKLSDRLILIDPNDVDHPPAINLFDFGLERARRYDAVEREKLLNGAISLYDYIFGALLGAELTARQSMIFRYLARLMMEVPGANIHTLMDFIANPENARPYLDRLNPTTRSFFETQFPSRMFDETRGQVLTRLLMVLADQNLERMFSSERNTINFFEAMNQGSVILINTAKDLLKQEGCQILGRFFIALILQATQERAVIAPERRRSTFVYIDEAHDYFDEKLDEFINQARKFKVGLTLAHQNLGQLDPKLRASVMSSTAIKLVGGVSSEDAKALAAEFQCDPGEIMGLNKDGEMTRFFYKVRNAGEPRILHFVLGEMENMPRLTDEEYDKLREENRARYTLPVRREPARPVHGGALGAPEVL